jgi:O-antigen biosynthesis protein WbqP
MNKNKSTILIRRLIDVPVSLFILILVIIPGVLISIAIKITSKGKVIYWSQRIGKDDIPFMMPKFRTMSEGSPAIATHLLQNPDGFLTPIGSFLRNTSLDEIPQLYSIFKGDMTFVGPRPALYNQDDLIQMRREEEVNTLLPGITGWAQINGRDEVSIEQKVNLDKFYLQNRSFYLDLKIIAVTLLKVLKKSNVKH